MGRALRGRRGQALVATKCGLRWDRTDGEIRFDVADPDGGRVRIHYNLRPESLREECEASLRRLGVGVIAYSLMARGLLTGKVGIDTVFPESDHRHANPVFQAESRQKLQPALERARPIAEAHRVSLGNLAVAWVLATPGIRGLVACERIQATCPPSMEKVAPLT